MVHELLFDDPAINAAWQNFRSTVHVQISKVKDEYRWNGQDLADPADYYY